MGNKLDNIKGRLLDAKELTKQRDATYDRVPTGGENDSEITKEEGPLYHIHVDGERVTQHPMPLNQILRTHGGSVKRLEADGKTKLVPHNPLIKKEDENDDEIQNKIKTRWHTRDMRRGMGGKAIADHANHPGESIVDKQTTNIKAARTRFNAPKAHNAVRKDDMEKDELNDKIKAKMKSEMDKRGFKEADATRHVVDRDRGDKLPKPKTQPLLQNEHDEVCKVDKNGQWSLKKDNSVKPFGESVYNPTANLNRKATRTGEVREDAGRNQAVRNYTTSGSSITAAHENAQQKEQDKKTKASTKKYSPEELAAFAAARGTTVSKEEEHRSKIEREYGNKTMSGDALKKTAGWSYSGSTGNFNHPLHGSVKVRGKDAGGFEVVHNGKIISSHTGEDRAGAINSAASHMKGLNSSMSANPVKKEEVSENAWRSSGGEC